MSRRATFSLILAVVLSCPVGTALAGVQTTIPDVPSYLWYKGCGPTAGGMVIGYWDAHGYPNMITAGDGTNSWSTNQAAVKAMIASSGHIADYWGVDDPPPHHSDDCVADFMLTSRDPRPDGATFENQIHTGLIGYANYTGYTNAVGNWRYFGLGYSGGLWGQFRSEIDSGRPMVLYVDSTGDGTSDHFVPAFGYRYDGNDPTNPTNPQYLAYNTYEPLNEPNWYPFVPATEKTRYAITSGAWFDPYNAPPVASAGGPYVLNTGLGGSINLDGSGSSDTDGNVVDWAWDLNQDGYADLWGETTPLTAADLDSLGWTLGEWRDILLEVTDNQGATDTAMARLTYVPEPASALLLGLGAALLAFRRNRRAARGL